MDARDLIAERSGKRPSKALGALLDQVLLPAELVLASVRGTVRMQNAWLVVTPAVTFIARDGLKPTIEGAAGTGEHVAWRSEHAWGELKLHLELRDSTVTLSQLKQPQLDTVVAALDRSRFELVGGRLPALVPTMAALDRCVEMLCQALPSLSPEYIAQQVASDAFCALAGALSGPEDGVVDLGVLLVGLGSAVRPFAGRDRRELLVSATRLPFRESLGEYELWRLGQDTRLESADHWRAAGSAFADALAEALLLIHPWARHVLELVTSTEHAFRVAATPPPVDLVKPDAVAADALARGGGTVGLELVETLERLQSLRQSGALTESEYAALKQQALQG